MARDKKIGELGISTRRISAPRLLSIALRCAITCLMAVDRTRRIGEVLRVLGSLLSSSQELKQDVYLRLNDLRFYSKDGASLASIPPKYATQHATYLTNQ